MEVMLPAQLRRDQRCLIRAGRAWPTDIEFLQADNISRHAGDHLRDAAFRTLTVDPDAAAHVISGDAKAWRRLLGHRRYCEILRAYIWEAKTDASRP